MQIPLPRMPQWFRRWLDWVNVPLYKRMRRIDVIIGVAFIFCVGWYWFTTGWIGALQGGALFVFLAMCALWIL